MHSYEGPPQWVQHYFWWDLTDFVERVRAAHRATPFWVTSWWRSPTRNAQVGGDPWSQHLVALAIDAVPVSGRTIRDLALSLRRSGLVVVEYDRHVHAQLHPAGFLQSVFSG